MRLSGCRRESSNMPELPDITVYVEALERHIVGHTLERLRIIKPFVLRSFDPPVNEVSGKRVIGISRIGKRISIGVQGGIFIVIHLMIAGRLRWTAEGTKAPGKIGLAAFDLPHGTLVLTEAGSKRRASITLVRGEAALRAIDRRGLEVLDSNLTDFADRLTLENHTLKRALTDPGLFSGIGNAYSDEILHRARLSPVKHTRRLSDSELKRLHDAVKSVLLESTDRLRAECGAGFPGKVTAFHDEMAVHGKFGQPCPVCATVVQRIRYADNETNYCPRCQTDGKLLADRALSRLLKQDWPKSIDEL
jgi:formamidopyrimidine-DNA glycosylase